MIEGLLDGTIDCIATDHAPHSAEEKSRGLRSLNGIVGLECAFPVLYTELVEPGIVPFATLLNAPVRQSPAAVPPARRKDRGGRDRGSGPCWI